MNKLIFSALISTVVGAQDAVSPPVVSPNDMPATAKQPTPLESSEQAPRQTAVNPATGSEDSNRELSQATSSERVDSPTPITTSKDRSENSAGTYSRNPAEKRDKAVQGYENRLRKARFTLKTLESREANVSEVRQQLQSVEKQVSGMQKDSRKNTDGQRRAVEQNLDKIELEIQRISNNQG